MPEALSPERIEFYGEHGYLILENRIPDDTISRIRDEIARFEEEARGMTLSNDRLDLEDSHTPDNPPIRRIKLPHRISDVARSLMFLDHVPAPVRALIGPDLRRHTTKLNMKCAGYGAAVEWHQDFAFNPHTNDDVLAVGVIIDDMGLENRPLMVFPGTHRGPIFDHHVDGVFAAVMDLAAAGLDAGALVMTGGTAIEPGLFEPSRQNVRTNEENAPFLHVGIQWSGKPNVTWAGVSVPATGCASKRRD